MQEDQGVALGHAAPVAVGGHGGQDLFLGAAPRELVSAAPDALSATPPPPHLNGRVVLVEVDGSERSNVTGLLALTAWVNLTPRHQEVNVVNGAWSVPGELLRGATALSSIFNAEAR